MMSVNNQLYGYDKYLSLLTNLYSTKSLPNSLIISGNAGIGKKTFISHFFREILFREQRFFSRSINFENLNEGNIEFIKYIKKNETNNINIESVREIIDFCKKKSFNDYPRFIVIRNIENFNINSINSFLKILENPPENIYFILIRNSEFEIYKTILSRCVNIKINFSSFELDNFYKKLLIDNQIYNFKNNNFFSNSDTPGIKIKKTLYIKQNHLEHYDIYSLVLFCLNDFKLNKNFKSLDFGIQFAKFYFFLKYKDNFKKYNLIYINFKNSINNFFKFNVSINHSIEIFKNCR